MGLMGPDLKQGPEIGNKMEVWAQGASPSKPAQIYSLGKHTRCLA